MRQLLCLLSLSGAAVAQTGFEGPVLGLVHDSSRGEVMRISGIPGSSRLVAVGAHFEAAAVHAGRGWVLGRTGANEPLVFGTGAVPVQGSLGGAQKIVFSESGLAAAAWYPNQDVVQIVGGLPAQPAVKREFAVGQADSLAISDDGRVLAVRQGSEVVILGGAAPHVTRAHGDVSIDDPPATSRRSALVDGAVDVRFAAGSEDLVIAAQNTVLLWHSTAKAPRVIAEGFDGVRAAWLSPDRVSLYAVQGQALIVRELASNATATYNCACHPDRISLLATPKTFLISAGAGEPLWLFEAGASPRILFVPAPAAEAIQ
jgi:hypothetical protein